MEEIKQDTMQMVILNENG